MTDALWSRRAPLTARGGGQRLAGPAHRPHAVGAARRLPEGRRGQEGGADGARLHRGRRASCSPGELMTCHELRVQRVRVLGGVEDPQVALQGAHAVVRRAST